MGQVKVPGGAGGGGGFSVEKLMERNINISGELNGNFRDIQGIYPTGMTEQYDFVVVNFCGTVKVQCTTQYSGDANVLFPGMDVAAALLSATAFPGRGQLKAEFNQSFKLERTETECTSNGFVDSGWHMNITTGRFFIRDPTSIRVIGSNGFADFTGLKQTVYGCKYVF